MKPRIITLAAIAFALTGIATSGYASHSWSIYHWARNPNPFTLTITDSMTSEWQSSYDGSVSKWSDSNVLNLASKTGSTDSKVRRRCNPNTGQIIACNLSYGNTGWLGIASINIDSSGHITRGSAKMNDFYTSYWAIAGERNHVVCQEIGHLFGLGHTSENGSSQGTCMDYSSDISSQWPNAHDYQQLASIYQHLDSYTTVTASSGGAGSGFTFPADLPMGVPVHVGRFHEVWVASDNQGGQWIHHIRVVPDEYRRNP